MDIDILCPLYNAEGFLRGLHASLLRQENVQISSIRYALTRSKDSTENILKELDAVYELVEPKNFSHSLTREMLAKKCSGGIIVFISQDVQIVRTDWLYNLTRDIERGLCEAAYSRQLSTQSNIEQYTRERNYAAASFIKSKADIEKMGLMTFFFSDASSAIRRDVFETLHYYDGKDFASNEDQYIAYKLIMNGYRIKYCADSEVMHSHCFHFWTLYKRYRDTGKFYRAEPYMNSFGTNSAGAGMAIYILKRILEDKNWKAAAEFIPNMTARFLGMKVGSSRFLWK